MGSYGYGGCDCAKYPRSGSNGSDDEPLLPGVLPALPDGARDGPGVCEVAYHSEIKNCTWDATKLSIVAAAQAAEEARLQELENAAWYKDEFKNSMVEGIKSMQCR